MDRHFVAVCTEREVKVSYVTICTQMSLIVISIVLVSFVKRGIFV